MRKLEQKFPNELVVIGVHAAKFPNEKDKDNLYNAVKRFELGHPVINDVDMEVARAYDFRAWPTLWFIDPMGKLIGKHEGELPYEAFEDLLTRMVAEFDAKGILKRSPPPSIPELEPGTVLSFPGKVLADPGGRLFICDTNHNRILVTDLDGKVRQIIGDGKPGLDDGDISNATFDHPQGAALDGEILYVADTENHAIRQVDLAASRVQTIAGNGQQGNVREGRGPGRAMELNSPWDVVVDQGTLYISMAGTHQLWSMDLDSGDVGPFAGSGQESLTDGPLGSATLAQPSGITKGSSGGGGKLYFADSETSSIRSAGLDASGRVQTIVGLDLFIFGDVDGADHKVRLQHPIGITWHDGTLYVADTYNHKIKRVLPETRSSFTFVGNGEAGFRDGNGGQAQLSEPTGLSAADGRLYIADTNNHAVRVIDLDTGDVTTLEITGVY
ncbi:MAG: alkyl hydroperoxide reductase [SAR202 cluster bacterium Io17-Chloro-G2]|nr:MAG: alkyl hydroperoxide reductase [SAR202 cluster bacterium Io17-Chloro-G2]